MNQDERRKTLRLLTVHFRKCKVCYQQVYGHYLAIRIIDKAVKKNE